jgi:hypothetical protein
MGGGMDVRQMLVLDLGDWQRTFRLSATGSSFMDMSLSSSFQVCIV